MKFCGYFLIVWDFINYAKSNSIPVGPGRGSAAGSLVSYCLGITDIDPIKYGLFFERFLNPERISMPDVDVDFCVNKRDKVIEYVKNKYGENNVSQISTFSTMSTKAAIKDVARVLDIDFPTINKATKTINNNDTNIMHELKTNKKFKEEIAEIIKNADENGKKLLSIALKLENNKRHMSTHAAGIVISDKPITDLSPIAVNDNALVTQYSKDIVEATGLIKFDFLGLKNLTIIDNTLKLIKEKENIDIDWTKIDLNDQEVLKYLSDGNTIGIFQLESDGMKNLIKGLKPTSFEDLIALVALYRPGPIGSGMVKEFVDRKHGKSKIEYPLPQLEPILKETYGIMVYQEQVMQIANVLAGYSMAEADVLRKIMGKKQKEKIPKEREKFLDRCKQNNIDIKKAQEIFDMMEKFAEYGFNKSHSTAYAYIAFQTAYLKYYYPKYFILESLNNDIGDKENARKYVEEAIKFGINLAPPDINKSGELFTLENGNTIRFGFLAIESIGKAIADSILETRKEKGEFASLQDFLDKINKSRVNIAAAQNLIKAGCFDSIPPHSKDESIKYANKFYQEYKESKKRKTKNQKKEKEKEQNDLFSLEDIPQTNQAEKQEEDKTISPITNNLNNTIKNTLTVENKIEYEKSVLGVSTEQLNKQNILSQKLKYLGVSIEMLSKNKITFYGIIKSFNDFTSKNDNKIIDVNFHTQEKDVKLTTFDNTIQQQIKAIDAKNDVNQILKIECDIRNYKGQESYIVKEIKEIDISNAANAVILKIDASNTKNREEEILLNIKNIVDSEKHDKTHRLLFYIKKNGEHFTLHATNTFVSIDNETLNKLSNIADKVLLVNFNKKTISVKRINNQNLLF
jgi:DNA polymerase-3 subunit alpha